jgi:hypothetical protein
MLVIRNAQSLALEEANLGFWLQGHLRKFFPERSRELAGERFDKAIAEGIAKARSYGFREPGDISRFLDVSFELGLDFDRDPATVWTQAYLREAEPGDGKSRMDALVVAVEKGGA